MSLKQHPILVILCAAIVGTCIFSALHPNFPRTPKGFVGTHVFLVRVGKALEQYYSQYAKFPTGDSRTVGKILLGVPSDQNPQKNVFLVLINEDKARLSRDGDLVDYWGQPIAFRFDNFSYRVQSFGKNHKDDDGKVDDVVHRDRVNTQAAPMP
jgi:hypothetical protein